MHTVEMSSSEATNTFEPTFWPSNPYARQPKEDYVYGTVEETSWDGGKNHHSGGAAPGNHDSQLGNNSEREHVYGTITTHHNNHGCVLVICVIDFVRNLTVKIYCIVFGSGI